MGPSTLVSIGTLRQPTRLRSPFQLLVDDVASGLRQDGIRVQNSMPTA